ncbi:nicotinate-nucleotide--dimethylbenzimidazole phosphoribosyltransferase [Streptomyces sp. NPDC053367]|uniref:nicotinate-nucleotide--dimethylbenzimidazole phosphoribosyltransferase n=1 Tax=Streptomyces sp. NPDC053367 TaxID=3365700 RepID=UPI0037D47D4C
MTDTGQVPGEGLPENAGMVEQPGVPEHAAYTYLSETPAEDEDLLLPGAQSAWGNEVAPPAPEPVVEAVHEPDPHETGGRDSGSVDLTGVRLPNPAPSAPRRPLHLGPPIPDTSASPVRSLADRGPAGAPVRQPAPQAPGPEYFDVPRARETPAQATAPQGAMPQGAVPWGAPAAAPVGTAAQPAETVGPAPHPYTEPVDAAQATMARLTNQAVAATTPAGEVPPAHEEPVAAADQGAGGGPEGPQDPATVAPEGVQVGELPAPGAVTEPGQEVPQAPEAAQVPPQAAAEPVAAAPGEPVQEPVQGVDATAAAGPAEPQGVEGAETVEAVPAAQGQPVAQAPDAVEAAPGQPVLEAAAEAPAAVTAEPQVVDAAAAAPTQPDADVSAAEPAVGQAGPAEAPVGEAAAVAPGQPVVEAAAAEAVEPQPVDAVAVAPVQEIPQAPDAAVAEPAPAQPQAAEAEGVAVAPGQPVAEEAPTAEAVEPQPVDAVAVAPVQEIPQAPDAALAGPVQPEVAEISAAGPVQPQVAESSAAEPVQPQVAESSAAGPVQPQVAESSAAGPVQPQVPDTAAVAPEQPAPQQADAPAATGLAQPAPQPAEAPAQAAPQAGPAEAAAPAAAPVMDQAPHAQQSPAQQSPAQAPQVTDAHPVPEGHPAPGEVPAPHPQAAPAEQPVADARAPQPQQPAAEPTPVAQPAAEPVPAAPQPAAVAAHIPDPASQTPDAHPTEPPMTDPAHAQATAAHPQALAGPQSMPQSTHPAGDAATPLPSTLSADAVDAPQLGEFVPVEGAPVPTAPHLAPTPPHPIAVPAQREAVSETDGEVVRVQQADDLETRGAEQEDRQEAEGTAAVAEARQSTGPAAPGYDEAERAAVLKVMRERRDIRNGFRSDPIPHEVLLRVLEAAHHAPSVGHSQPWDFVVIRSADTRRAMHELAMRQREAYAKSLPKGRAKQFKELKIEAILDTPVNIVVTADPTRGGRHTLGRHTQPQMAPYSAALAVENLWLAARAEGLGVGWVSFFDEREMVRALGLPEHLEVIAYLCVGYVDEFPDEPELMQAGWSKRRPLSWVVHEETYGRRALPGEEPHDLLAETVAQIRPLDAKALGEAWERQKRMTKPAGALGMLEIISAQLSGLSRQCPPPIPEPAAVAIFAGDHGVHAQGVTPWPQEVTAQMVANFLGGGAVCNAFANQVGAEVCVIDVGVSGDLPATPGLLPRKIRAGTSDMTTGPAMTREEAKQAIEVGIETARDLVAAGNKALLTGEMGIANTTASAALISVFTGTDPAEVTGRGTGINDETLARKTEVVRRAIELHQPDPADPIGVLAAIGGFEHAAIVGLLLGGASLRTPVILDGVSAGAAALVARAIAPEVLAACIAGHRSAEPGHVAALNKLGLRPLVDLDLRLGEGTGALLALPLVQSTARAMHEVATFDSAGVTEK